MTTSHKENLKGTMMWTKRPSPQNYKEIREQICNEKTDILLRKKQRAPISMHFKNKTVKPRSYMHCMVTHTFKEDLRGGQSWEVPEAVQDIYQEMQSGGLLRSENCLSTIARLHWVPRKWHLISRKVPNDNSTVSLTVSWRNRAGSFFKIPIFQPKYYKARKETV